jgi:hypothetical protein
MKLTTLILPLTILLSVNAGNSGGNSDLNFGTHKPGSGTFIGNLYMHTLGHVVTDFPKYLMDFAKTGDLFGFITTILKFALYHNPVYLLQDIGGGLMNQVKGGRLV